MLLPLSKIILDTRAQPRAELDSEVIAEYAEAMKAGAQFPPVVVFSDGTHLWLADGWHRVNGAKRAWLEKINADVKRGTLRDAILYSVGANAQHGMRRTNADKRRAVMALLNDDEWRRWTDAEIARRAAVSSMTVGRIRAEIITNNVNDVGSRLVERNGTTYEMQTERIGRRELTQDDYRIVPYEPSVQSVVVEHEEPRVSKPTFNRTNDNIKWAWWTWNPVTGCKHGCPYCYARDIANRFTGHFNPEFHPDRLTAPQNTNPITTSEWGSRVFVCSMADLFGAWVPREWIDAVLEQVRNAPQWTFIFLSKNPERMATVDWPTNAWVGTTVDCQARVARATEAFKMVTAPVRFMSVEPFRERLTFDDMSMFNWLLIGGQSASSGEPARQPEWEWVHYLLSQAYRDGVRDVFWKTNLDKPEESPL